MSKIKVDQLEGSTGSTITILKIIILFNNTTTDNNNHLGWGTIRLHLQVDTRWRAGHISPTGRN